jgi:transitional endoplasmic reticulum ATPase
MVICFDELDGMIPTRSEVHSEFSAGEVNEFLSQLNNCSDRGIFVIGTTNRPEKIDPAVLRTGRMDKIIYVSMPNAEARTELFKLAIDNRYVDDSIDYAALAEATEGYVASDISYIVNEAALTAAIEDKPLTQTLILEQIAQTRSSVSKDDINEFEHMRARYESTNGHISTRRKIGYV